MHHTYASEDSRTKSRGARNLQHNSIMLQRKGDPFEESEDLQLCSGSRRSIIRRNGDINIIMNNLKKRRSKYLKDIYTTLVDVRWRWTLLVFFTAFILCWLFFAFIYYLIIKVHGDDVPQMDEEFIPCIIGVQTFMASFLYSLESQQTIGYGSRVPTEECPEVAIILVIQSITGVMIQAFMVGVVFAKLTRPKSRTNTLLFSRISTVCLRDGQLCLSFRVADMRKSFIIGATIKAQLIKRHQTAEGETIPYHQREIEIKTEGGSENLFFLWPLNIVHIIDVDSPFYNMSAVDLMNEDFELVVYLEGTAESTGTTMQARYSYLPPNVLWGHRFFNLIKYNGETENYSVDFNKFNSTYEIPTPLCSAKDLEELKHEIKGQNISRSQEQLEEMVFLEPELLATNPKNNIYKTNIKSKTENQEVSHFVHFD